MQEIHFRDPRAPHEIQSVLERELMTILAPVQEGGRLLFRATTPLSGAMHRVELRFEVATALAGNFYSFRIEPLTEGGAAAKSAGRPADMSSWFGLWTRHFKPGTAPKAGEASEDRYRELVGKALAAESHLATVESIQQAILAALRRGQTYSTAHKEGGTILKFEGGRFIRSDYGESNSSEGFRDEAAFLSFLRKFYDWETSKNTHPVKVPELAAWRLTLRLLEPVGGTGSVHAAGWNLPKLIAWVLVLGLAAWLGASRWLGKYSGANGGPQKVRKLDTVPPMPRMPEHPNFTPPTPRP